MKSSWVRLKTGISAMNCHYQQTRLNLLKFNLINLPLTGLQVASGQIHLLQHGLQCGYLLQCLKHLFFLILLCPCHLQGWFSDLFYFHGPLPQLLCPFLYYVFPEAPPAWLRGSAAVGLLEPAGTFCVWHRAALG